MRTTVLALAAAVTLACGCQSGRQIETRTHTVAPWQVDDLPTWEQTIETTVAPERWNEADSPHRISSSGNALTVRTTKSNHDAIFRYLATVAVGQPPR